MTIAEIQQEILRMKKEQDICILAHAYQGQEILEVADYTGDSYGLSVQASKRDCSGVIMCGVRFMAETCKILSPKKRVWLANPVAGCPMAEQLDLEGLRELKAQYPDYAVVAYINTTSELKTECDVCVTSSSAVEICKKLGLERMIWSDMYITTNTGGGYYDVADDTVDFVWLLHQRRVAAACTIACCDRWTDFAGLPDTGINTMILIYQGLMPLFAGAERTGHIFTHIHPLSTLFVQAHNRRHTVAAWTALECWGDFLCVADGSSRCAGASGKRRGKCLLLHSRLCKDGRIIKRHRFLSAFRQANQASLYP